MKSLNFYELQSYSDWIRPLVMGTQLQDIWTDGQVLVLELYKQKNFWLCFDLHPAFPQMFFMEQKPTIIKKQKPLILFLLAHARNLRLTEIQVPVAKGRVVEIKFCGSDKECDVELQLIPRAVNARANTKDKSISWEKPKELPPSQTPSRDAENNKIDWQTQNQARIQEWLGKKSGASASVEKSIEKVLEKKRKATLQIEAALAKHEEIYYRELGELLKYSKEVPEHLKKYFDLKLSYSENRERAFQKAKDILRKRQGNEARLAELKIQIAKLEQDLQSENPAELEKTQKQNSIATQILKKSDSKARKLTLPSGFEAVIGKSAKDNLAILRQARAWDYWFHLRDYPGAHAILFRNKNQNVPDSVIAEVSQWLVNESLRKKLSGIKFDVVVAECRYVKPVKGGSGLVTHQNSRTFTFNCGDPAS